MVADFMMHHINSLHKNALIFNREFLNYTSRNYVDVSLFRLLNDGFIKRLARGIYVRHDCDKTYSVEELAEAKARMWNRSYTSHPRKSAEQMKFVDERQVPGVALHAVCNETSFKSTRGQVVYKQTSSRRVALKELKTGDKINALWWLTKDVASEKHVGRILYSMNRTEKEEFVWSHHLMPGWLSDLVHSTRGWRITFPLKPKA